MLKILIQLLFISIHAIMINYEKLTNNQKLILKND